MYNTNIYRDWSFSSFSFQEIATLIPIFAFGSQIPRQIFNGQSEDLLRVLILGQELIIHQVNFLLGVYFGHTRELVWDDIMYKSVKWEEKKQLNVEVK